MESRSFLTGLTVKELKELIADWPETVAESGEPTEVWLEHDDGTTSQVRSVWTLNLRTESADILLSRHPV